MDPTDLARDRFKRLLLGLPQSTGDYAFLDTLVRFAEQLELDLDAMFVQEEALLRLASFPKAREFRGLGAGWQPVDLAQLKLQIEQSAALARGLFDEAVHKARIAARFSLAQGTAAQTIAASATARDIIVVVQPASPVDRITQQFVQLADMAIKSHAAVLIFPSRIARAAGPVAIVAANGTDPGIRAGLAIGAAMGERAVVIGPLDEDARTAVRRSADSVNVKVQFEPTGGGPSDLTAVRTRLAALHERIIVMARTAFDGAIGAALAGERSVPVLLVEPEAPAR
ncbi:MAG TPA: hypothetical protein VNR11_15880 [Xanthobacteraceae bacterium]|nr:hypothetical protein [Xanthobacteraceae bacterium]